MSSQFEQNLKHFQSQGQLIPISVKIKDNQYELQVRPNHTIQLIRKRFQRNKFISQAQVQVRHDDEEVRDQVKIGDLLEQIKQFSNGKINQICLQIVKKGQQPIYNKKGLIAMEKNMQTNVKQSYTQKVFPNKQQSTNDKININKNKQNKQKYYAKNIDENKLFQRIQQQKQKQQQMIIQQQKSQYNLITVGDLKKILQHIQPSSPLHDKLKEKHKQFFQIIKQRFETYEQILSQFPKITQKFNSSILKMLQQQKKTLQIKIKPTSSSKKSISQIDDYGNQQHQIIQLIQLITYNIANYKQEIGKNKEQRSKLQKKIKQLQKEIQKYEIQKLALQKQLKQQTYNYKQIQQQMYKINQKSFSQQQKYMIEQSNIKQVFNISTYYINNEVYQKKIDFLMQQIELYQNMKVNQLQLNFSFRGADIPFQVIKGYFDNLSFGPNSRVLLLLQGENNNFMSIYSTVGVLKKGMGSDKNIKIQATKQKIKKCESGSGFIAFMNQFSAFSSASKSQLINYDDKMLTFGHCFIMLANMKKKMEIQYRSIKKNQLKDFDNFDISKAISDKPKTQLASFQLFNLTLNQKQQKILDKTASATESFNIKN